MTTQYTGQTFELAQDILAGTTYATLDFTFEETPVFTAGIIKVDVGQQSEWFVITGLALVSGTTYRATVTSRGLKKDATSTTDVDSTLQKDHSSTATCTFVTHSLDWNEKIDQAGNNTWTGDNTFTDSFSVSNTTSAAIIHQTVTTTQRDALTGVNAGDLLYNSTTTTEQVRKNASWADIPTGATNSNATETASGKAKLGTIANQIAADLDTNVVQTRYLKSSSSSTQSDDSGKITTLNSSGKIPYTFLPSKGRKFGGTGADGVGTGVISLGGGDTGYVVKNYRSMSAVTSIGASTGSNILLHIKVLGDCDLTNCAISLNGCGGAKGAGGTTTTNGNQNGTNGGSGTAGTSTYFVVPVSTSATGGQTGAAGAAGTAGTTPISLDGDYIVQNRHILVCAGNGGAGGGGGAYVGADSSGTVYNTGADGGNGGGGFILEVAGNLTLTGCTITLAGSNGSNADNRVDALAGGGGGGGGAAGVGLIIYGGTITGSPTTTLTGGTGGTGGTDTASGYGGSGGAGGSNIVNNGTNGVVGTTGGGGNAGNGGAGDFTILANTVFA